MCYQILNLLFHSVLHSQVSSHTKPGQVEGALYTSLDHLGFLIKFKEEHISASSKLEKYYICEKNELGQLERYRKTSNWTPPLFDRHLILTVTLTFTNP